MPVNGSFNTAVAKIKGEPLEFEEFNLTNSKDLNPRYSSDSTTPKETKAGRKKVEFTMKRALTDNTMSEIYEKDEVFPLVVYNNDTVPPTPIYKLEGCRLSKDATASFNGQNYVTQDIDGQAASRTML